MAAFSLTLPDGRTLTGKNYFPETVSKTVRKALPLVIAVHGGTYSSNYFDADDHHSVRHIAQVLEIPVIAIDRPGYAGSSPLDDTLADSTFIQENGKYLHLVILPYLWEQYSARVGASSIFLWAHSIGAAIAVVAASFSKGEKSPAAYKLSGISISGVGAQPKELQLKEFNDDMRHQRGLTMRFPNDMKDAVMFGPSGLFDPKIRLQTERLQQDATVEELYDINYLWPKYWRKYASEVAVPVLYTQGEYDALWDNPREEDIKEFAEGFVKAPSVEARRLLLAPHCIELSLQSAGFMIRTFGFAVECATRSKIVIVS